MPEAFTMAHTATNVNKLRSLVYHLTKAVDANNPYGENVNWHKLPEMVERAFFTNEGFACGGRAILYLTLLAEIGIEARYVAIVEDIGDGSPFGDQQRTHASVDVFVDGKWLLSDPHFNVSACDTSTGELLSWEKLSKYIHTKRKFMFIDNGMGQDHFLNMEYLEQFYPANELCRYIFNSSSINHAAEVWPESWDGKIRNKERTVITDFLATYPTHPAYAINSSKPTKPPESLALTNKRNPK